MEPLDELLKLRHPDNPKEHNLGLIGESFEEFDFVDPVMVDDGLNLVAEGHGRLEQLEAWKKLGNPAPDGIEVRRGRWFVPVIRGVKFKSRRQLLKWLIAANRIGELGGWSSNLMAKALTRLGDDFKATGFGKNDLVRFMVKNGGKAGKTDADAIPEPPKRTVTKLGDLWILGDHRLICGETRDAGVVRRLVAGEVIDMLHADPPYGMGKEKEGVANDNLYEEKLDKFQIEWWRTWLGVLSRIASAYLWGEAPDLWRLWWRHLASDKKLITRNEIVWDKGHAQGERTASAHSYPPATERCLFLMRGPQFLRSMNQDEYSDGYEPLRSWMEEQRNAAGWTNGDANRITKTHMASHWFTKSQFTPIVRAHYELLQAAAEGKAFVESYAEMWARFFPGAKPGIDKHLKELRAGRSYFDNTHDAMSDVWSFPSVAGAERFGHATPKPVAMVSRAIVSSSAPGALVGVPFGGTGPEFIAAEKTSRRVVAVEIDPRWCDTIVERWQNFTGLKGRRAPGRGRA
jgi:DNA modification methylase